MVLALGVSRSVFHQSRVSLPKATVRSGIVDKGVSSLVPNPQITLLYEVSVA